MFSIPAALYSASTHALRRLSIIVCGGLLATSVLCAQENPVQDRYRAAMQAAFDAAVAGDFSEAERQLRVGGRSAAFKRPLETELTEDLAMLCLRLHESGEATAAVGVSDRAFVALGRVDEARGIADRERIRAHLRVGSLSSRVLHDAERARELYEKVIEIDPDNQEARERLAEIDLDDAITLEKIKEQELIASRKAALEVQGEVSP